MSFISDQVLPILEKELLNTTPQISDFLLKNIGKLGSDFIQFIEHKMKNEQLDTQESKE